MIKNIVAFKITAIIFISISIFFGLSISVYADNTPEDPQTTGITTPYNSNIRANKSIYPTVIPDNMYDIKVIYNEILKYI